MCPPVRGLPACRQDPSHEVMVNKTIILFIVKFIGFYLLLNTIYGFWYESFNPVADPLTRVVTHQCANVISWVEPGVKAEPYPRGPEVSVKQDDKVVINVFEGCNGVNVMIVFLSFVVAFSGTWKSTIAFSAAGIGVIYLANLGRVITLFFIAKYYPQSLYFFHKYLFTAGLYLFVFVMWYLWIEKFRRQNHA
jgi:exosortase family protein XrtF